MSVGTAEVFNEYRPLLFSIAYRMLGSASDAEDILQEAFLRWQEISKEGEEVRSSRAFLSTVVTRLCIDELRSAKARREVYIGPWLPEPIATSQMPEQTSTAELAESLSLAFLRILEKLDPVERAVFLLREVFGYSYGEVAHIVGKTEANCRQMVHRAHNHLQSSRPRFPVSREQQERLTRRFMEVCEGGDINGLLGLLAADATFTSDGGGKVQAARNILHGANNIAKFLVGILKKLPEGTVLTTRIMELNGQPGIAASLDGQLYGLVILEIEDEQISGVNFVLNPDKLGGVKAEAENG